jgi:hypothetical protein
MGWTHLQNGWIRNTQENLRRKNTWQSTSREAKDRRISAVTWDARRLLRTARWKSLALDRKIWAENWGYSPKLGHHAAVVARLIRTILTTNTDRFPTQYSPNVFLMEEHCVLCDVYMPSCPYTHHEGTRGVASLILTFSIGVKEMGSEGLDRCHVV